MAAVNFPTGVSRWRPCH